MTVIFAVFIYTMFILYFLIPDSELSEWENRYLQMRPELTLQELKDGSFIKKYEEYVNDQLPFRDTFIKAKAVSEACLFKAENNGIVRGRNSYLFTKEIKGTDTFYKNISIIDEFSESVSNDVTVCIAPNAAGVLKDYIPLGVPIVNQYETLKALGDDNSLLKGANVVDLYSVMNAHGDEYIYYRTDHHWTTYGAYLAYIQIVGADNAVSLSDLTAHDVHDFYGTLYAKYKGVDVTPDVITFYDIPVKSYTAYDNTGSLLSFESLYDFKAADKFDKYALFLHGNFGLAKIKSASTLNGKTAVIFKDSYANCLIPFLTYNYENLTVIDLRFYSESVSQLISDNPDADIIFINNFDFLNEDNHFYRLLK